MRENAKFREEGEANFALVDRKQTPQVAACRTDSSSKDEMRQTDRTDEEREKPELEGRQNGERGTLPPDTHEHVDLTTGHDDHEHKPLDHMHVTSVVWSDCASGSGTVEGCPNPTLRRSMRTWKDWASVEGKRRKGVREKMGRDMRATLRGWKKQGGEERRELERGKIVRRYRKIRETENAPGEALDLWREESRRKRAEECGRTQWTKMQLVGGLLQLRKGVRK